MAVVDMPSRVLDLVSVVLFSSKSILVVGGVFWRCDLYNHDSSLRLLFNSCFFLGGEDGLCWVGQRFISP